MDRDRKKLTQQWLANNARYVARNQQMVLDHLKHSKCCDCDEADPVVLDFDHVDRDNKKRSVAKLIRQGASVKTLFDEIAKCVVRCANCHRRKTAKELGWFRAATNN